MNLLLDIGGTTTRVSAATGTGELLPPVFFHTEQDMEANIARIAHIAEKLLFRRKLDRIVAGVAGSPAHEGTLISSPNLPLWEGKSFGRALTEEFGVPSYVINDAILGGLGEAHRGAGKHARVLLYMTFGTGIGASRIIGGVPDFSVGSEAGHQYLSYEGDLIEAETLVSGAGLEAHYGKPPKEIADMHIWREISRRAAVVLHNTILHFVPDTVVLGGSLMKERGLKIEDIEMRLAEIGGAIPKLPRLLKGTLGDTCGLYGAQAYARLLAEKSFKKSS